MERQRGRDREIEREGKREISHGIGPEKSHNLPSASRSPRKAGDIIESSPNETGDRWAPG